MSSYSQLHLLRCVMADDVPCILLHHIWRENNSSSSILTSRIQIIHYTWQHTPWTLNNGRTDGNASRSALRINHQSGSMIYQTSYMSHYDITFIKWYSILYTVYGEPLPRI